LPEVSQASVHREGRDGMAGVTRHRQRRCRAQSACQAPTVLTRAAAYPTFHRRLAPPARRRRRA
jgi:hypothetical protein